MGPPRLRPPPSSVGPWPPPCVLKPRALGPAPSATDACPRPAPPVDPWPRDGGHPPPPCPAPPPPCPTRRRPPAASLPCETTGPRILPPSDPQLAGAVDNLSSVQRW